MTPNLAHDFLALFGMCRIQVSRLIHGALILVALSILSICGCGSNRSAWVGSGDPPDIQGVILWHDLLTTDAAQARDFYGALFGWRYGSQGHYSAVLTDGREIGGIVEIPTTGDTPVAARWIPSLSVKNLERAMAHTEASGGQINEGPMDMGQRGTGVLVRDAGGAQLVLLDAATTDSVDRTLQLNDWLWDELWTEDPQESLDFYGNLAGFSGNEKRDGYWILKSDGKWRAGLRKLFNRHLAQRWVPVVRVADPEQAGQRAEKLGGRVLIGVVDAPEDRRAALIADPAGALLIVQEWPDKFTQGAK